MCNFILIEGVLSYMHIFYCVLCFSGFTAAGDNRPSTEDIDDDDDGVPGKLLNDRFGCVLTGYGYCYINTVYLF